MTTALALKETASIYEGVPASLAGSGGDALGVTRDLIEKAENETRERRLAAIRDKAALNEMVSILKASPAGIDEGILRSLDETIEAVGRQASEHAEHVEFVERDAEGVLAAARRAAPDDFKGVRKLIARFIATGKEMHSDIVELYYFLLSIKADLDPDACGGPSFANPDELKAFLDAELSE
jgi:hypothetical protein